MGWQQPGWGGLDAAADDDGYFFTPLNVTANEPLYVEIAHVSADAAGGLYTVSAGPALINEAQSDGAVYLPLIVK